MKFDDDIILDCETGLLGALDAVEKNNTTAGPCPSPNDKLRADVTDIMITGAATITYVGITVMGRMMHTKAVKSVYPIRYALGLKRAMRGK